LSVIDLAAKLFSQMRWIATGLLLFIAEEVRQFFGFVRV
jgi:hypothetical protein